MSQAEQSTGHAPRPDAALIATSTVRSAASRVYVVNYQRSRRVPAGPFLDWIEDSGFDALLLALDPHQGTADVESLPPIVEAAASRGLAVRVDLKFDIAGGETPVVRRHPDWYSPIGRRWADPRQTPIPPGRHRLTLRSPAAIRAFIEYWSEFLGKWAEQGIEGYRCMPSEAVPPDVWRGLIADRSASWFSVWTKGLPADDTARLPRDRFDTTYNSLAWWDFGRHGLAVEAGQLALVAPVANAVGLFATPNLAVARRKARRQLSIAARNGNGILLPMGFEFAMDADPALPRFGADDWSRLHDHALVDLSEAVSACNRTVASRSEVVAPPSVISPEGAPVAVLFAAPAQITLANRFLTRTTVFDPAAILPALDGALCSFVDHNGTKLQAKPMLLRAGEVRVLRGVASTQIATARPHGKSLRADPGLGVATAASRVAIEAVEPAVDHGRFAVKRIVGERVDVAANIFADGHGMIAAALQWRAADETDWHETPMRPEGNDRWVGAFLLDRVGAWRFRVVAWPDRFATFQDEFAKKRAAGLDVTLETQEGKCLLETIAAESPGSLDQIVVALDRRAADLKGILSAPMTEAAVARADRRPGRAQSGEIPVVADRRVASFAAWYEMFPRNQSGDPRRHGTFRDVVPRLPHIRRMGFDVLYFPPVHPIGRTNRKGRGNGLTAAPDDPGSPYAIGGSEGGHDAIHPSLGSMDDFRALRDAAAALGIEIALDFAIQCSPDHPWLREHPEWFDWRPDGGLRYAENPPKKYEDIVNVDFHRSGAIPDLWVALRDIVAYWALEGVRIFRVDNPHTKPFPFWEWMIEDIRSTWPDVVFLAEAFTRPKIMYRLAKLGFTQSYSYFTWRDEKERIEAYLRELTGQSRTADSAFANVADFFRPNFFVNTPDINPLFLQRGGRAGFLIRAALAATLSGLWGMLQGFELCESAAVPGREEYADSDKYQIRIRPDRAPGDIVDEISLLNAIRRANPALHSHLGLAFLNASSDQVLWYQKQNVDRSNVLLIAVSLDPFATQTIDVELPLREWNAQENADLMVDDLVRGGSEVWAGPLRTISLDPRELPFGIWRASLPDMT